MSRERESAERGKLFYHKGEKKESRERKQEREGERWPLFCLVLYTWLQRPTG